MRLGDDQFVSTVAKVKQEDDADEAECLTSIRSSPS
jgi:DNA gyrase subunit A